MQIELKIQFSKRSRREDQSEPLGWRGFKCFCIGLLDEIIIQIGSVSLGHGKPVFPRRVFSPVLQLVSVGHVNEGMAELRYRIDKASQAGAA